MSGTRKYNWKVLVSCMTYNHAPFIVDAMDGFCMQDTNFPFVCVIVDDASADGESDIIKGYLGVNFNLSDPLVVRNEETDDYSLTFAQHKVNHNCFFAVYDLKYNHHQIKKTKSPYLKEWRDTSEYIALCEGDDYWIDSKKLEKQVCALEQSTDYVMSHTSYKSYFESCKRFADSKDIINYKPIKAATDVFRTYRIRTLTVLMRTDVYIEVRSTDPFLFSSTFMMGDGQLWYEMARKGKIHFIPEVMCVYRVHEGSASRQSVSGAYRFALSCAEMQLYVARRDKVADRAYFESKYISALYNYLLFEPQYQKLFESDELDKEIQMMPSWRREFKKDCLIVKYYLGKVCGRIQKLFIKSY